MTTRDCACKHFDACRCWEMRYGTPCDQDIDEICHCSCHDPDPYETNEVEDDAEAMGLEPDDTRVRCWFCKRRRWNADVQHPVCTLGRFRMWDPIVPRMCDDFVILPPRERVALP